MNRNSNSNNRNRRAIRNNRLSNRQNFSLRQRRALNLNANGIPRRNLPRRNPRMRLPNRNQSGPMFDPPLIRNSPPSQMTANNQSRIVHREPLATLNGSVNFAINTFQINPGLVTTFPWLSAQALAYESYKVNAMHIQYRHTTNEFTGKGSIVIAPDYDAADVAPTSIVEAEQMADAVQGAATRDWTCILRPRGIGILGPKRYTRSGALSANEDIKTYDIAQIHVVTQGQADTAQIGQLWIYYDITLSEPQPPQVSNVFLAGSLVNATGVGGTITNLPGTNALSEGAIHITHVNNTITASGLVAGFQYRCAFSGAAGTVTSDATVNTFVNATLINNYTTPTANNMYQFIFSFLANDTVVQFNIGGVTVLTTPTFFGLEIEGMVSDALL
jgi:hypothetical protein